jgi:hypothetical protein
MQLSLDKTLCKMTITFFTTTLRSNKFFLDFIHIILEVKTWFYATGAIIMYVTSEYWSIDTFFFVHLFASTQLRLHYDSNINILWKAWRSLRSQSDAFCIEMKHHWFPCASWTAVSEYKKLYTVATTLCVPRFHVQTVRILYLSFAFTFSRCGHKSVSYFPARSSVRSTVLSNIQFAGTYGIRVKNCFAFNKLNSSVQLIDDKG